MSSESLGEDMSEYEDSSEDNYGASNIEGMPQEIGHSPFPGRMSKRSRESSTDNTGMYHGLRQPGNGPSALEQPIHQFKKQRVSSAVSQGVPPCYVMVQRVLCSRVPADGEDHREHPPTADYLDVPRLFANDTRGSVLRGKQPVHDIEEYCEINSGTCMVVYRTYSCTKYHRSQKDSFETFATGIDRQVLKKMRPWFFRITEDGPPATCRSENIVIISDVLQSAMDAVTAQDPAHFPQWNAPANLTAPYNYFYHFRRQMRQHSNSNLTESENSELGVLLNYVDETQGAHFDKIDALFAGGRVRRDYLANLFGPNEVVVTMRDGYPCAFVAETSSTTHWSRISLKCWSWKFDGGFRRVEEQIDVSWPDADETVLPLTCLAAWPLRLDQSGLRQRLERRGAEFWSCRHKKFVSYLSPTKSIFELQTTNPKYMIDFNTYRQMYPAKVSQAPTSEIEMQAQGIEMDNDKPPSKEFCILLPPTMLGYGFHDKKWRDLSIEHMQPIEWNTRAFNRLVLNPRKKELIKALVTVHVGGKQNADVVEDKGNGLIVLLHGSPGTGKTLTAESVAEIAKKPLYRVTCGDIGTDAEVVEKYLESVLLIGTIWGCVVLLDEADIFLEERQATDLARNALVSVFLRVLEYYDGILILTSNRVGTFDEAFKSRVQLAVHYPALNEKGRFEIWHNFITMLKERDVQMNSDELVQKVPLLALNKLNGRQIRNLIWTAGQLARYKKEPLEYAHLEQVIEIANEFEHYLKETHGQTDEEYAKVRGDRNS